MRRFYLHARKGVYYAELVDPETGHKLTAKSTRQTNKDDALLVVADWLKNGVPIGHRHERRAARIAFAVAEILQSLHNAELSVDDAVKVVDTLKARDSSFRQCSLAALLPRCSATSFSGSGASKRAPTSMTRSPMVTGLDEPMQRSV